MLLEVKNVSRVYRRFSDTVRAVDDISLRLEEKEILGIVGESGSGKSTLLRQIGCMEAPTEGSVIFEGKGITGLSVSDVCADIQMVFQDPLRSFDPRMTVRDSIMETIRKMSGKSGTPAEKRLGELCEMVGLDRSLAERVPGDISGGQCQRFAIARALAAAPKLLLCDEVTSALDVYAQMQIVDLLLRLRQDPGLSIIFVSHDIALVSMFCDNILVMKGGRAVEEGTAEQVCLDPGEDYTKLLLASVLKV